MRVVKNKETLFLTPKDYEILDTAMNLLDDIYTQSMQYGTIENLAAEAIERIKRLLSDELSEIEGEAI